MLCLNKIGSYACINHLPAELKLPELRYWRYIL